MYPNKNDKIQKLRKVQRLYRKNINKNRGVNYDNKIWKVVINICLLVVIFFFITSALFDMGVPLPSFFGR